MKLYSVLLNVIYVIICTLIVNANTVDTTNINLGKRDLYCCDKVWQGDNSDSICIDKWQKQSECKWQKQNCSCDKNCGWFGNIEEIFVKDCH